MARENQTQLTDSCQLGYATSSVVNNAGDTDMTTKTFEAVTYKLAVGADEKAFLATVPATNAVLQQQPGFIWRRLARGENGEWLDCAEWESLAAAKAGADAFCADARVKPFLEAIDMATASMRHADVLASVG
jgi:hypothetical protein